MIASDGGAPHSAPGVTTLGTGFHNSVSSGFAAGETVRPSALRGLADCCAWSAAQKMARVVKETQDDTDLCMVVEKHTPWGKEVIDGRSQPAKIIVNSCITRKT
jgi:hypothetical protein